MNQWVIAFALMITLHSSVRAQEQTPAATAVNPGGDESPALKYHDGTAEGKKSVAGTGEMITFGAPAGTKIGAIKIHGSRYGVPKAPDESFVVYVLSGDQKRVLHAELVPY